MLLLIDNYDSFTYNLVQYVGDLGVDATVVRNDAMTVEQALALKPSHILLSPGPGYPDSAGICIDLIEAAARAGIPLMGVCLGHQAIGHAFGGKVIRAPKPMHGKVDTIHHEGGGVLRGIPTPFRATRYHSLVVERDSLPACLEATASSADGCIMALRHRELPIHGVQFHPESIESEHGHEMLANFLGRNSTLEAAA
jgi:anthranilate synthase component II